jgi:FixJ family two-component response regulator
MSGAILVAVVEEDPSVRRAIGRLLTSAGFEVDSFGSVEEFLASTPERAPGCALIDVHPGRRSGLALAQLLAQRETVVPVIFLAGDRDVALGPAILESGRPCIIKPIDEETLLSAIARVIAPA